MVSIGGVEVDFFSTTILVPSATHFVVSASDVFVVVLTTLIRVGFATHFVGFVTHIAIDSSSAALVFVSRTAAGEVDITRVLVDTVITLLTTFFIFVRGLSTALSMIFAGSVSNVGFCTGVRLFLT